ncbi:hypothetical protein CALVIDRAFT_191268 [Calocera viscosa TUFC12733]|uniref:Uncharacterized protein n=1 Tax=Calocera viscosa (strain TUFC12733) TaxID=1330018 RepID=A0A167KN36_CALVF|nr:hypothetical protein CALVIDRAFT_191268 [Calocera viscosa TUFC12733]
MQPVGWLQCEYNVYDTLMPSPASPSPAPLRHRSGRTHITTAARWRTAIRLIPRRAASIRRVIASSISAVRALRRTTVATVATIAAVAISVWSVVRWTIVVVGLPRSIVRATLGAVTTIAGRSTLPTLAISIVATTVRVARSPSTSPAAIVVIAGLTAVRLSSTHFATKFITAAFGIAPSTIRAASRASAVAISTTTECVRVVVSHISPATAAPTAAARPYQLDVGVVQSPRWHANSSEKDRSVRGDLLRVEVQNGQRMVILDIRQ